MNLEAEIAAARQREADREAEAERKERERLEKLRGERESKARDQFAYLLGAEAVGLIVDFEGEPHSGQAWPALLYNGRQYHYEWREHNYGRFEHYWVREDGARHFFNAEDGRREGDIARRRDQALVALASCASLPPYQEPEE